MRYGHFRRPGVAIFFIFAVLLPCAQPCWARKTWTPEQERKAGDEAIKRILEETPEWANEEQQARCQAIVDAIAPHTNRPEVKYTVRLLDSAEGNAFSLPGGTIFVTRGLLEQSADREAGYLVVQSDHELAGILAHEIAHNCHYHGLRHAERSQEVLKGGIAAALLALVLGGGTGGAFQVLGFGLQAGQGILNHYSVEYESEADRSAVEYLVKTPYNPNGLLTFIERLAATERLTAPQDLGIYQTHPYPVERVQAIKQSILAHGVEINRRAVTNWRPAEALEALVYGHPAAVLILWDRTIHIFRATGYEGETPVQRAKAAERKLNEALSQGMAQYDIAIEEDAGGPYVTVMGERLLSIVPEDVEEGSSPQEVAAQVVRELRAAMFGDALGQRLRLGG
ncbi:MAG: M48 family metallopeptidase [Candidatus Zipacnadales bacterium]